MKKIGVIGDKQSVLGFKAAGFVVFMTDRPDEAEKILKDAERDGFAVMYITEDLIVHIPNVRRYIVESELALIPIPGKSGSLGYGIRAVKSSVERAVGADILFKDE